MSVSVKILHYTVASYKPSYFIERTLSLFICCSGTKAIYKTIQKESSPKK